MECGLHSVRAKGNTNEKNRETNQRAVSTSVATLLGRVGILPRSNGERSERDTECFHSRGKPRVERVSQIRKGRGVR